MVKKPKILQKLQSDSRATFLGVLHAQLKQQAVTEVAHGGLVSPVNFSVVCNRVVTAWRGNALTNVTLKVMKVTDDELRKLLREVLEEIGLELE